MVGFSWWDPRGTPAADARSLFELAGRRPARMRANGRPPEEEVPLQPPTDLAPEHMVTGVQALIAATRHVVKAFSKGPHIFNLGHGITPEAHPDHVQLMIDTVRGG